MKGDAMYIGTVSDFRRAIRHGPYTFPGGYPVFFVAKDGAPISFQAAKDEKRQIIQSIGHGIQDGWHIVRMEINFEDTELRCAHTDELIECAYPE